MGICISSYWSAKPKGNENLTQILKMQPNASVRVLRCGHASGYLGISDIRVSGYQDIDQGQYRRFLQPDLALYNPAPSLVCLATEKN